MCKFQKPMNSSIVTHSHRPSLCSIKHQNTRQTRPGLGLYPIPIPVPPHRLNGHLVRILWFYLWKEQYSKVSHFSLAILNDFYSDFGFVRTWTPFKQMTTQNPYWTVVAATIPRLRLFWVEKSDRQSTLGNSIIESLKKSSNSHRNSNRWRRLEWGSCPPHMHHTCLL